MRSSSCFIAHSSSPQPTHGRSMHANLHRVYVCVRFRSRRQKVFFLRFCNEGAPPRTLQAIAIDSWPAFCSRRSATPSALPRPTSMGTTSSTLTSFWRCSQRRSWSSTARTTSENIVVSCHVWAGRGRVPVSGIGVAYTVPKNLTMQYLSRVVSLSILRCSVNYIQEQELRVSRIEDNISKYRK